MDKGHISTNKMAKGKTIRSENPRLNSQNRSRSQSYSNLNMLRTLLRCTGLHTSGSSNSSTITEIRVEMDTPQHVNISKILPDGGNQFDSMKDSESCLQRPKCREHDIKIMVTVTATITPAIPLSSSSMSYHRRISTQT